MKVYIPYFERGWGVQEADEGEVKRIGNFIYYRGWVYGPKCYTTKDAAQAYINKNYYEAQKYEANI